MKRLLAVLITLSLLFGCVSATSAAESAAHQIERKTFPFYFSVDQKLDEDFPLFFVDGADDLPYVDLNDWAKLMPELINTIFPNSGYQLTAEVNEEENKVILRRENKKTPWKLTMIRERSASRIMWPSFKELRRTSGGTT